MVDANSTKLFQLTTLPEAVGAVDHREALYLVRHVGSRFTANARTQSWTPTFLRR